MRGEVINMDDYRYGFNGMEKDNEVKGNGNSYTTEYRHLDPRIGRWLSLDPMMGKFPWQSPYVGFDNNPILLPDPSGGETEGDFYNKAGKWLGSDGESDDKVYTANSVVKNDAGTVTSADGKKELGMSHSDFKSTAGVLQHESSGKSAEEVMGIAHAVNNATKYSKKSFSEQLMSYSSVENKQNYSVNPDESLNSDNWTRSAIIDVLTGGADVVFGATHWDGRDLLARPAAGRKQAKIDNAYGGKQGVAVLETGNAYFAVLKWQMTVMKYYRDVPYYSDKEKNQNFLNNLSLKTVKSEKARWFIVHAIGQTVFELPHNYLPK